MNNTIRDNYKTITNAHEKPRKAPEWLQRVAEVNAAARANNESYGKYVSRIRMIRLAESKRMKIPEGYLTAREWARIRKSPVGVLMQQLKDQPTDRFIYERGLDPETFD